MSDYGSEEEYSYVDDGEEEEEEILSGDDDDVSKEQKGVIVMREEDVIATDDGIMSNSHGGNELLYKRMRKIHDVRELYESVKGRFLVMENEDEWTEVDEDTALKFLEDALAARSRTSGNRSVASSTSFSVIQRPGDEIDSLASAGVLVDQLPDDDDDASSWAVVPRQKVELDLSSVLSRMGKVDIESRAGDGASTIASYTMPAPSVAGDTSVASSSVLSYVMADGKIKCGRCTFLNPENSGVCGVCSYALITNPNVDIDEQIALRLAREEENRASRAVLETIHEEEVSRHAGNSFGDRSRKLTNSLDEILTDIMPGYASTALRPIDTFNVVSSFLKIYEEFWFADSQAKMAKSGADAISEEEQKEESSWDVSWHLSYVQTDRTLDEIRNSGFARDTVVTFRPDGLSSGKPVWICLVMLGKAIENFRWLGDNTKEFSTETHDVILDDPKQCIPLLFYDSIDAALEGMKLLKGRFQHNFHDQYLTTSVSYDDAPNFSDVQSFSSMAALDDRENTVAGFVGFGGRSSPTPVAALKQFASYHLHPEAPVVDSGDGTGFGRNYFHRPSAVEQEDEETMLAREEVLADVAPLKRFASYHLHPERPVEPTSVSSVRNDASAEDTARPKLELDKVTVDRFEHKVKVITECLANILEDERNDVRLYKPVININHVRNWLRKRGEFSQQETVNVHVGFFRCDPSTLRSQIMSCEGLGQHTAVMRDTSSASGVKDVYWFCLVLLGESSMQSKDYEIIPFHTMDDKTGQVRKDFIFSIKSWSQILPIAPLPKVSTYDFPQELITNIVDEILFGRTIDNRSRSVNSDSEAVIAVVKKAAEAKKKSATTMTKVSSAIDAEKTLLSPKSTVVPPFNCIEEIDNRAEQKVKLSKSLLHFANENPVIIAALSPTMSRGNIELEYRIREFVNNTETDHQMVWAEILVDDYLAAGRKFVLCSKGFEFMVANRNEACKWVDFRIRAHVDEVTACKEQGKKAAPIWHLYEVTELTESDVVFDSSDHLTEECEGCRRLKELIAEYAIKFAAIGKNDNAEKNAARKNSDHHPDTLRHRLISGLVKQWRCLNPPGRFLQQNGLDSTWCDMGDLKARALLGQTLMNPSSPE